MCNFYVKNLTALHKDLKCCSLMLLCLNESKSMLERLVESFSSVVEACKEEILPNAH